MSEVETNSIGLGLMGGAVVKALLDHFVQKGVVTGPEVHDILKAAYKDIVRHEGQTVAGLHAEHLLSSLSRHFTESDGFRETREAKRTETFAEHRTSEEIILVDGTSIKIEELEQR